MNQKVSENDPEFSTVLATTVVGQWAELSSNSVPSWQAALVDKSHSASTTNLIRYAVFDSDVLAKPPIALLIGTVKKASDTGDKENAMTIAAGEYLRFRSVEKGVDNMPTLISQARNHLKTSRWQRANKKDFMIENQQYVDLYIAVEKK